MQALKEKTSKHVVSLEVQKAAWSGDFCCYCCCCFLGLPSLQYARLPPLPCSLYQAHTNRHAVACSGANKDNR
jgi:hypothetical protein